MPALGAILSDYGASIVRFHPADGETAECSGPGGQLARAVERRGVAPLAHSIGVGERLELLDGDVGLEVRRDDRGATMRVSWASGPSYEERLRIQPGAPAPYAGPTDAAPATHEPAAVHRITTPTIPAPASRVSDLKAALHTLDLPLYATPKGVFSGVPQTGEALVAVIPPVDPSDLGAASFRAAHGVKANYVAGAMAGAIASVELVVAMARSGYLAFYGSGGVPMSAVAEAVAQIKGSLGDLPAGFNLLHNPVEPGVEEATVDLYLANGVDKVSASAFMRLTPAIVRYRVTGLREEDGRIVAPNSVFAKVSRPEVAEPFMRPPPDKILDQLLASGKITPQQAALARRIPLANDVTAEADSGGHTDRRPLPVLLPTLLRLRDRVVAEQDYGAVGHEIRVGAAGGLGDPVSVHGAFAMGADYVLTGSVNQCTPEAGTSDLVRSMLLEAGMADCDQGPAPDMFELGALVQVLGRGTLYAQRGHKLYGIYKRYGSIDEIPKDERDKIEKQIFRRPLDEVWAETLSYWKDRDPKVAAKAEADKRMQMSLAFRWYLGMTSRWARLGTEDRKRDFQIWCGPSMGLFNEWVRGTSLEPIEARSVVAIADSLMHGAAVLRRVGIARACGLPLPAGVDHVEPLPAS